MGTIEEEEWRAGNLRCSPASNTGPAWRRCSLTEECMKGEEEVIEAAKLTPRILQKHP
jgi:hypothetical protein